MDLNKYTNNPIQLDIEFALLAHNSVENVRVLVNETPKGDKSLVAYVIPKAKKTCAINAEKKIDFSLFYFGASTSSEDNKYKFYIDSAKFADDHGFEAIWTPERHFDPVGGLYPNPSILSAALATITKHVKLRAGSVVLPLHDPLRVAEEWSVVDNLSNGRVGFSIASGWHVRDYTLSPENYALDKRKDAMLGGLAAIKTLWAGNSISRKNGAGENVEIEIFPKPVQKKLPLWIAAARNPETFIEAGRLGTNVIAHLLEQTIDELSEKIVLYRESLIKNGHDPKLGRVTLMLHTFLGDDLQHTVAQAKAPFLKYMGSHIALLLAQKSNNLVDEDTIAEFAERAFERYVKTASLIGTPESTIRIVDRLKEVDVDEIACLIDWMDDAAALQGLSSLQQLKTLSGSSSLEVSELIQSLSQHLKLALPHNSALLEIVLVDALPSMPTSNINNETLDEGELGWIV